MRRITLGDFLTDGEINKCVKLWKEFQKTNAYGYAQKVCEEVVKPNIERINKSLEQENDPMYLAYMIEYVMYAAKEKK